LFLVYVISPTFCMHFNGDIDADASCMYLLQILQTKFLYLPPMLPRAGILRFWLQAARVSGKRPPGKAAL